MFAEKMHKDTSRKLEIKLVRDNENLLTSWQISDFISQLTKHYYKNELLNTISLALKYGISPKNLIIFEGSFEINRSYSDVDGVLDLTNPSHVKTLYHLGEPISMFPNQQIMAINSTFSYFREINKLLKDYNLSRLDKNNLHIYYSMVRENAPHDYIITEIEYLTKDILNHSSNEDFDRERFSSRLKKLTRENLTSYAKYEKNLELLEILSQSLLSNEFDILKEKNYKQLERNFFRNFFTKFEKLKRPIIGIFDSEKQQVQIFCQEFMNKTKHEPSRFLDLKSISHNSPYEVIFTIGVPIVVSVISVLNICLTNRRLKKETDESAKERKEAEEKVAQTIADLKDLTELEEVKSIEDIPQEYIKKIVEETYKQNSEKFQEPVGKYGFVNTDMEVNVVENSPPAQ